MPPPVTMATAERTLVFFQEVDALLLGLGRQIVRVAEAGELNAEQFARLGFSLDVVNGLRRLFLEERARQFPETQMRES